MHHLEITVITLTGEEVIWNAKFNSDFSGDITIMNSDTGYGIIIPSDVIIALAAHHVRNERISKLEFMGDEEVLGIKK